MRKDKIALNLLAEKTCENCCYKNLEDICQHRSYAIQIPVDLNVSFDNNDLKYLYVSNLPEEQTCGRWRHKDNPKPLMTKKEVEELMKAVLGDKYNDK
jgi:hypothetical protein